MACRIRRPEPRRGQVGVTRSGDSPLCTWRSVVSTISTLVGGSMSVAHTRIAAVFALAFCFAGTGAAQVPSPTVEGPITSPGGAFIGSPANIDLASVGYEQ